MTATKLAAQQKAAGFKIWRPYDGPNGMRAYLDQIAAANPDLLKLEVIGQTWGTDPEGDGPDTPRDVVALKLTKDANTVADNSRPAVLYSSTQHAREWISTEVNRRLLEHVIKMYREGKAVRRPAEHQRAVVRPGRQPRRVPVHVRSRAAVAEEPARQRRRQPDHAERRRRPQPELSRALEVRRRGFGVDLQRRDLPWARPPLRNPKRRP